MMFKHFHNYTVSQKTIGNIENRVDVTLVTQDTIAYDIETEDITGQHIQSRLFCCSFNNTEVGVIRQKNVA